MGCRTLIYIRHGQYDTDPERLTDLGRAQAELTAARIAALPIDKIWSSRLPRAIETADILAARHPNPPRQAIALLNECLPGRPRLDAPWVERFDEQTFTISRDRVERAWKKLGRSTRGDDRTELIICHGNTIRAQMLLATGLDVGAWPEPLIQHASLTTLRVSRQRTRWLGFNDVGHLPRTMQTES